MCRLNSVPPPGCNISTCCLAQTVGVLPSLFMYASASIWPCALSSLLSLISLVSQDKRELRVAVELQTGCHGDCQRLCDSTACVWHIMEASEAPGYHVVEAAQGRLTDVSVVLKHSAVSVRPVLINDSFFLWLHNQRRLECWHFF